MTLKTEYRSLIGPIALRHGIDPYVLEAVVHVESRGRADAFRFEPDFYTRYRLAEHPDYTGMIPRRVAASYGLSQIMYPTARELGYVGEPEGLFVPQVNLHWGAKKLKELIAWADGFQATPEEKLKAALAAYNGGKGGNTPGTVLRNEQYALKVLAALDEMRQPEHG